MMKQQHLHTLLQTALLAIVLTLLVFLFKDVDVSAVLSLLRNIGPLSVVIVALYGVGCLADTAAWQQLLAPYRRIPFHVLFRVHLAGEAMYRFIPTGVVVGESVKVALLQKYTALSVSETITSLFLRKLFMGLSQAFYIGASVSAALFFVSAENSGSIVMVGFVMAGLLFLLFIGLSVLMAGGTVCQNLFGILLTIPHRRFRAYIETQQHHFVAIDRQLTEFITLYRLRALTAAVLFTIGWLTELAETVLILAALSAAVSLPQIMLFEPVVSLLRSIAFILPAGLGVMDAGYISSFRAFGVDDAVTVAASFIIIKRIKEILWIVAGVSLTALMGIEFRPLLHRHADPVVQGEGQ